MHRYLIKITMPDGSRGRCHGLYASGCEAITQTLDHFPEACGVSALCQRPRAN